MRSNSLTPFLLTGLSLVLAASQSHAQVAPPTIPPTVPPATAGTSAQPAIPYTAITTKIEAALAAPALRHAAVGVLVKSLDTGAVVYEHNADLSLNPASCNKLLTGSTALLQLGGEFRYHTTLYRTGALAPDGTLTGDLYLRGTGDPSLTSADLLVLGKALFTAGVRHLHGHIYADATRFDDQRLGTGWEWDDEPYDYTAQVSALNCDENVATVQMSSGAPVSGTTGTATVLLDYTLLPPIVADSTGAAFLTVRSLPDARGRVHAERSRGHNEIDVFGTPAAGGKPVSSAITIDDPATFTVYRLMTLLPQCGIDCTAPVAGAGIFGKATVPADAVVVSEKVSDPLSVLLTHCWKVSDNLYAEAILKTVGAEKGKSGSSASGAAVVAAMLQKASIDTSGLVQVDGSGLSRHDLVTPHQLVDLLTYMEAQPAPAHDTFRAALPIAGVDGTLRNRMKGTVAQGRVQGKTGTLSHVSCLSGFATSQKSGERFVFSVLVNNFGDGGPAAARTLQDTVGVALTDR